MFSDEKWFDADGQMNSKNDIIYAENREHANSIGGLNPRTKFPFKVMIWCGITYNGVSEVVVLPSKKSFTADFYIEEIIPIIKRDGNRLIGDDFVFQQDGASSHTSKKTTQAFQDASIKLIEPNHWPPNSPDLNPLDYFFWNEVSTRIRNKNMSNRTELIKNIKKTIKEIPLKMIRDAIDQFRSRFYIVEKNNGGLILNKYH